MIAPRSRLLATAAIATTLALATALAGCASSTDNAKGSEQQYGPAAGNPQQGADQPGAGKPGTEQQGAGQPGNAAPGQYRREQRSIVYTGELSVRVADVDQAAARAGSLADGAGGFVAGDKRSSNADSSEAHLTLRLPADRFVAAVDDLAKLGREESRAINTEDVTQQVIDLDAQIASQKASVERTRELLARAQSMSEIVSVEGELAKRESALNTLEARKQRLADLTSLSTVTVHLLGPSAPGPADDDPGFLAGLKLGWQAFLGAVTVVLAVLGFLLPFLVVLAVPGGLAWWLVRRRRATVKAADAQPGP